MNLYLSPLLTTQLSSEHFELSYWVNNAQSSRLVGGRGGSQKIMLDGKSYVLRRYLRGGLMAKLSYDTYLWLGEKNTRAYKEQQIIDYARQQQLPVPACVAYCVKQQGLLYRAAIITEYLENIGTLAGYLDRQKLSDKHWQQLALVINNMHKAKINHADLNADNILVHALDDGELGFSLIDFDKAKIEKDMNEWPLKNINRLQRSLVKLDPIFFKEEDWDRFIPFYLGLSS